MKIIKPPKLLPDGKKCLKCPYYLGYIKCIVSPCKECILNKRKTHPYEGMQPKIIR